MIDWKKWILYLLVLVVVVWLLAGCGASKKSVSINKVHVDSAVLESQHENKVVTIDSTAKKSKVSNNTRETTITYEAVEVDSGTLAPGLIKIKGKKGKEIVFLPHINIKETGAQTKQEDTHLQKKDAAINDAKKQVEVKKDVKEVEKKKLKINFNFWWLLLLIPAPLLFKRVREFIRNLFII